MFYKKTCILGERTERSRDASLAVFLFSLYVPLMLIQYQSLNLANQESPIMNLCCGFDGLVKWCVFILVFLLC